MNSAEDRNRASALTRFLRAELRDARFSMTRLAPANIELVSGADPTGTVTRLEETSEKKLDAQGIKALHQEGDWKQQRFRSNVSVKPLTRGVESTARLQDFERLLDDIGVLSEGHVAHALGSVLNARDGSTFLESDSPLKTIGVSETPELWGYLLVDACLATPRRTANKVLRWARGAPLAFETRVLLGRLDAASSFTLAGGLAVERLPRKSEDLDGSFPTGFGLALSDYLDRTLLRIPCKIAPVLSKATKITTQHDGTPATSWETSANIKSSWPLPPGGVLELSRALSLVCDVAVETPMIWTDYLDHAHFGRHLGFSNYSSSEPTPRTATGSTLTADDLKQALRLQPKFRNMPDSAETALRYWLKSKARRPDLADRLVFLRTALEALFLDRGNNAELAYRLATNGAWYTGRNPAGRRQRFDTLKELYGVASGAAHSGSAKKTAEKLLTDGQEICRLAILKRLRSGQEPVWKDIVFGR